jgi:predicted outer membrane repeat protein
MGGAIVVDASTYSLVNSNIVFINNSTKKSAGAGVVFESLITIANSSISYIKNTSRLGGGAMVVRKSNISLTNSSSSFISNTAGKAGGAIVVDASTYSLVNSNIVFINNSTKETAGAGLVFDSLITIANSSISYIKNTSKLGGGAMVVRKSNISLTNSSASFISNTVGRAGGAISIINSTISFANSSISFIGNTAKANGGAIVISTNAALSFANSQIIFIDNKAGGVLNDIHFYDSDSKIIFYGINTLVNGLNTTGDAMAIIQVSKNAALNFEGASDIKNTIKNSGKMVFKADGSNIGIVEIADGAGLYLINPSSSTKLTVGNLVLKKNGVLSIEVDFKNKTAAGLALTGELLFEVGAKLEIINLTPDAASTKITIINADQSFDWTNLIYDKGKYELSFEDGKLMITNKPPAARGGK